jgi:GAF domain-containing protein
MGRGPKPTKGKAKPAVSRQSPKSDNARVRDLEKRLADARERERATGEILQVISNSPADLQPVFDAIVRSAQRLLRAHTSSVFRRVEDEIHLAAYTRINEAADAAFVSLFPMSFDDYRKRFPSAELDWVDGSVIQVPDFDRDTSSPANSNLARARGFRGLLQVPMRHAGHVIGLLRVTRRDAGAFADDEITLLKTFADQAVIAIENVRLFNETKEALEQQMATGDILRVISSCPTDAQPVFEAITQSAMRLCDGTMSVVSRYDGDLIHLGAYTHVSTEGVELIGRRFPMQPMRDNLHGRVVLEGGVVHIPDVQADSEFNQAISQALGTRSTLGVPMLLDGRVVGAIAVARPDVRPFTDKQIALLKTFADQAVIAIENVRLFNETKEALDQQTATSEVLRVIASSPTELQPVLDAMAESVARLCGVYDAVIWRLEGDGLRPVAHHGPVGSLGDRVVPVHRGTVTGRTVLDRQTVQVTDLQAEVDEFPEGSAFARQFGHRSIVSVPLLRERVAIGVMSLRRAEVQPFTQKQIDLLKTFADQAVIAIENARLFTELQASNRELTTALDTQTATSDILRVISRSQTDVQPVFDAILASAVRLLHGYSGGLTRIEGDQLLLAAITSTDTAADAALRQAFPRPVQSEGMHSEAIRRRAPLNIADAHSDPQLSEGARARARARGYRSGVAVPMLRHDEPLGAIAVSRREPGGFTDDEVVLLQTFADQAVIAIENVQLFTETKERLEQQTATSEILRVISQSPTDVQPVFDAIAENALHLCDSINSVVGRYDGDLLHLAAHAQQTPEAAEALRRAFPMRPSRATASGRAVLEGAVVHIADVQADPEYAQPLAAMIRVRAAVAVPLMRDGRSIGTIAVGRSRPFSDKHIALLQTFADQAVIAIENVRLFSELQEKNLALTEALEQQTATSEILRLIAGSPTDLESVLGTVAETAMRVCGARDAIIYRCDGDVLRLACTRGPLPVSPSSLALPLNEKTVTGRSVVERRTIHVHDLAAVAASEYPEALSRGVAGGSRTVLATPLLQDGEPLGAILIRRGEVQAFTDKQIALLETFAAQAVIAIENVRLFTELQEKNQALTQAHATVSEALDRQTATAKILGVISSSPTDIQPVFATIADSAMRLLAAWSTSVWRYEDGLIRLVAARGGLPGSSETFMEQRQSPVHPAHDSPASQTVLTRMVFHSADVEADASWGPPFRAEARMRGFRSIVAVPMLRAKDAVGVIAVTRVEVGGFTPAETALLKTFADQAVIAIENVRLFKELEARTQELTRSVSELRALSEVGQAISSTLDLQAVLSTIVARATNLSGTDAGVIYEYDDQRDVFLPRATAHLEAEIVETMLATPVRKGEGATGQLAEVQEPIQVPDILAAPTESRVRGALVRAGYRALLAIPLAREGHLIGGLTVIRRATGAFAPQTIELLQTFATQSSLAIQNARLFREIEEKSRQLEVASQHKSEFLANMSHELRTPLNAIIGFSEVLTERMFGDLNEKQEEYLKDIYASGQHLLSLINDILDLSKIEAGRMELELTDFDLPTTVDNALTLVRERAGRRGIALHQAVDQRLGQIRGDERKIKQVLLNLLSNALKFTPEGGRVDVRGTVSDGMAEVSVSDTGVGIAPEDQEAVFEEFRQVGTADKKVEGTGLGLTLCRKFIELHGGRIWVTSLVGTGSTFTFTIPVRRGE